MEIILPTSVDGKQFESFLKGLSADVLRAKGIVSITGEEPPYYFKRLEGPETVTMRQIHMPRRFEPVAILIGVSLDAEVVKAQVECLRGQATARSTVADGQMK